VDPPALQLFLCHLRGAHLDGLRPLADGPQAVLVPDAVRDGHLLVGPTSMSETGYILGRASDASGMPSELYKIKIRTVHI
jgi:hypothetical protein